MQRRCTHRPHQTAVHELMIHVHQVFVHERPVTGDGTIQRARLVGCAGESRQLWKLLETGGRYVAGINKNQAVRFSDRKRTHAIGPRLLTIQIRHADAGTTSIISPAVVVTQKLVSTNHAE